MAADSGSAPAGSAGHGPAEPLPPIAPPAPPGAVARARTAFRIWRRSRPFWGGLLSLLGGAEIAASERAPLPVIIHLGAQGLTGYILPVVIILCGLLIWFNPAQRIFYSLLGVVASLATFITSNLGGFGIGLLAGIVGGSLAFAWAPGAPAPRARGGRRRRGRPRGGKGQPEEPTLALGDQPPRMMAMAAPLAALAAIAGGLAPSALTMGWGPAAAAPAGCVLGVICGPSPSPDPSPTAPQPSRSPSPTPGPTPSGTPSASPAPGGTPSPTLTGSPSPTPRPTRPRRPRVRHAAGPAALAAASPSSITAGQSVMTGLSYDGVANVATADGSVPMLKFSMRTMTLTGGTALTVSDNGQTVVTRSSSLAFSGNVVLYTTKISADLIGIPVTFTPQSPPPLVLPSMVFTNVVAQQPSTMADTLQADGLSISLG